ncbi:MAG: hypothetical protein ACTSPI_03365 [Candidatus Heimdallarchaeaceae archaeon]
MKIRLTNLAHAKKVYMEVNKEYEVDDSLGKMWIEKNLAVEVSEKKKMKKSPRNKMIKNSTNK